MDMADRTTDSSPAAVRRLAAVVLFEVGGFARRIATDKDEFVVDWGAPALANAGRPVQVHGAVERRTVPESESPPPAARRPSIAVLPFVDTMAAAEDTYFGDGIVEEIVGGLAALPDLFVISRNSTLRLRATEVDARRIGRELGVRYILNGTVRRVGPSIRISCELIDADSQSVLWTFRVAGKDGDLFALQDQIAQQVVTTIAPNVQRAELKRILRKHPENFDAYECMLRGLDLVYRLRRDAFDEAKVMFERSARLDPHYATPLAYLALWHSINVGQGWSKDRDADADAINRFAAAALERNHMDPLALAVCGHLRALNFRDYDAAFALFDRAIQASPNSAIAWVRSSPAYSYVGDAAEARRRVEEGLRLSPFDPHIFFAEATMALACYVAGDFEAAVTWGSRSRSGNPEFTANLRILAASLVAVGRATEAAEVAAALMQVEPGFRVQRFCRGHAFKDPARREEFGVRLAGAGLPE